jgi:hypothetical protein
MTRSSEAGPGPAQAADDGCPQPSRRSVLRGAAGASMAAVTVAAGGATALAAGTPTAHPGASVARQAAETPASHDDQAIVAHVRDARSGEIDLFRGTRQVRVHDRELAARLIRASR